RCCLPVWPFTSSQSLPGRWMRAAEVMAMSTRRRSSAGGAPWREAGRASLRTKPRAAAGAPAGGCGGGGAAPWRPPPRPLSAAGGELGAEHGVVERGEVDDLGHQLVDLAADRSGRLLVAVGLELRQQVRRELVVGGVAQRLEAGVGLLDAGGKVADLLDLPLVVAHVVAALELVGEEVVARVVVVGERQI